MSPMNGGYVGIADGPSPAAGVIPENPHAQPPRRFAAVIRGLAKGSVRLAATVVLSCVVAVLVWQAAIYVFNISKVELATPLQVFDEFKKQWRLLGTEVKPTLYEAGGGFLLSILLGVPLGFVLARPGRLSKILTRATVGAQIFPKVTIAPLMLIWFGFGPSAKVLFVILLCFFPIAINSAAGFSSVPKDLRDLGSIVGLGSARRFLHLQLPWALPQIFTGFKVSASLAVTAAIVAEFVGSTGGLGMLITQSQGQLNIGLMLAAVLCVTALGFIMYGLVSFFEALVIPWHISQRHDA